MPYERVQVSEFRVQMGTIAVAHGEEEVDDELLEEGGRGLLDALEEIAGEAGAEEAVGFFEIFFRRDVVGGEGEFGGHGHMGGRSLMLFDGKSSTFPSAIAAMTHRPLQESS